MSSLEQHRGYLVIDHTNSPGIPVDLAEKWAAHGTVVSPGSSLLEADTYTCSHCNSIVIRRPERVRPREVCRKCMHIVCDGCIDSCVPFAKIADLVFSGRTLREDEHTRLILPAGVR